MNQDAELNTVSEIMTKLINASIIHLCRRTVHHSFLIRILVLAAAYASSSTILAVVINWVAFPSAAPSVFRYFPKWFLKFPTVSSV